MSATTAYNSVINQYVSYVSRRYGPATSVVYDGYFVGPSTKDHEHARRSGKMAASVNINLLSEAYSDQQSFLANSSNKIQFIKLLSDSLQSCGHLVTQASGDADTEIAHVAIQLACDNHHVTVISDDTDVLVLLVFHWPTTMCDILMFNVNPVANF